MFKIIKTGSSGNCFVFKNIMIDIGIPYSLVKDNLNGISHIFISHIHGDHINKTTVRKIAVNHENIIFVCGKFLEKELLNILDKDKILIVKEYDVYDIGFLKISPVKLYHDVDCFGIRILDNNGHKHLHITDTFTLDGIEAKGYNSASIECNHEKNKALELIEEAKENGEFSHLKGALNSHLSVDKTIQFCKDNGIKKLIPVHIGNSTKKEVMEALKRW